MIPYVPQHMLVAGRFFLTEFQMMLAAAVITGAWIFHRRTRHAGIPRADRWGFLLSILLAGFIGADLLKLITDDYPTVIRNPSILFLESRGLASMGGFCGGLLGALIFCVARGYSMARLVTMLDAMAYAAPFAGCVGRVGCFLAHDHRGLFTTSWIGVQFPEGTRYDLALLELLFLVPLALAFWWLGRRPRPSGFFFAPFGCLYGLFRVWLETQHDPSRFVEPAMMAAVAASGWMVTRGVRAKVR